MAAAGPAGAGGAGAGGAGAGGAGAGGAGAGGAGPAGAGPAGGAVWPRKDEFLRLKALRQTLVLLSDAEVGKEYYVRFGWNADPLFYFTQSLARCILERPNGEKVFVGDIVDYDGNILRLGVVFDIINARETIFIWPPPNEGTGGTRERTPYQEWNGGSGGTASRKKSRKLKRKNRKSRKNRR